MGVKERFLVSLAAILTIINLVLVLVGQRELAVYYVCDSVAFLAASLYFNMDRKTTVVLRSIGGFIFVGFLLVVIVKVIDML